MLNLSEIVLGYDGKSVLSLDSLKVEKGGQCLITGASGSGKTSLLYAIAGLISPLQGIITIDGINIVQLSEAQRDHFRGQDIGIIFQTLHLVKSLTVIENLMLASYVASLPQKKERAVAVLEKLGLAHKQNELPEKLSQGQAQRVAIARAVLHNPALILADEPTSSLDDDACESVIKLIKEVATESGSTLVISTHDSRVKAHFSNVLALGGAK